MTVSETKRLIVGLGTTGLSCARWFHSRGETFSVVDSRNNPPGLAEFRAEFPGVHLHLGSFDRDLLCAADELVMSPGISLQTPEIQDAIQAGVVITGDIDIFSRHVNKPLVAVTGSNGKSTVVTLLGHMARAAGLNVAVGGNLDGDEAAPALDLLRMGDKDLFVLELSSFQLETTRELGATAAVILNVSEDHMDRYATLREYHQSKQRIFLGCQQAVVNRDDAASVPETKVPGHITYGLSLPGAGSWGISHVEGERYLVFGDEVVLAASELKIAGRHNVSNALAALALGDAIGLDRSAMVAALREFGGLPHRCQWLRKLHDVDYYNDSKGTNVGATLVAIESIGEMISGRIVLIAGGVDKESDFAVMRATVERFVRVAVLIGRDAAKLAAAFTGITETTTAGSMEEAVATAARRAEPGDAVLLSPACASFDMFDNFLHRGRVFTAAVEGLV